MDVERVEVLNVSGADSDHVSAFQKREKIPRATNESRSHIPKQRRATGESVNRPRAGSRAATGSSFSNATSAPRSIPTSAGKKTAEPSTGSSAYSFDDTIDNPFKPSTPSSFTPSMEPTGFFKPVASLESTSLPTESFMKSAARKPATTSSPDQGDFEPNKASVGRSRNASVSGMRPNHDDMILPAVARRIKEQGLHEHDVIAYSDAYDAPLYKLPSTPAYENNPFASYDRAKAVSSSSLAQPRSPEDSSESVSKDRDKDKKRSKIAGTEKGSELVQGVARKENRRRSQTGPPAPAPAPQASARPSIEAPSPTASPSERAGRAPRSGVSRSNSRRQRRQQQEQYEQNEQRRQQEPYEQHEPFHQQEQYAQHEQLRQQQPQNTHDATSAQEFRPERPRRARRNTDRQLQADSPAYNEEPMPRWERQPPMPGKQENARTNGSDNLYPQNSHYQGYQGYQGPQGAQKEWNDPHDPQSRQQRQVAPPESWDRRRPTNDDAAQPSYAYKQNGNSKNGHEMASYGAQEKLSRHSQQYYAGDQLQGYPPQRDAHNGYRHQQGYDQEQGGYRHQPQDDYTFQGNGSSQHPIASRPSYPQPEMVQVEMSQLDHGIKEDEQHGVAAKMNPSQENIKKKKETLCCIIC
ncbi:unnamed protein product [Mortierella alpina]